MYSLRHKWGAHMGLFFPFPTPPALPGGELNNPSVRVYVPPLLWGRPGGGRRLGGSRRTTRISHACPFTHSLVCSSNVGFVRAVLLSLRSYPSSSRSRGFLGMERLLHAGPHPPPSLALKKKYYDPPVGFILFLILLFWLFLLQEPYILLIPCDPA